MALKKIQDAKIEGSRVLARFDFNVPQKNGEITDTSRIDLALPTIRFLLEGGVSKLTLMSHLGRPKGEKNAEFSMENVAAYLSDKLGEDVILTDSAVDNGVKELLGLKKTKIVLLENLILAFAHALKNKAKLLQEDIVLTHLVPLLNQPQ